MISLHKRIDTLVHLGEKLAQILNDYKSEHQNVLSDIIIKAKAENPWFTEVSIIKALQNWIDTLNRKNVSDWAQKYKMESEKEKKELNVAVINAGNIPFIGLHDLLSVIITGNNYIGKNATGDSILLPFISEIICDIENYYCNKILFVPKLIEMDAVIATGNNNSARYFEYYFGKYPHIIRKNRNGAGVLTGDESVEDLNALGNDVFSYFGLGCRNISKLYVPAGYDFSKLFESIEDFHGIANHNKYMNNFEYNNSVLLLKKIHFLQNGFLIIRKENQIPSPVAVLHYEEYKNKAELKSTLINNIDLLQCIATPKNFFDDTNELKKISVNFGKTQSPALWDYADGIDTIEFLCRI